MYGITFSLKNGYVLRNRITLFGSYKIDQFPPPITQFIQSGGKLRIGITTMNIILKLFHVKV